MVGDKDLRRHLIQRAREAALAAYCPYSRFRVGAAVCSEDGEVFAGANVENASYGLSLCAERSALAAAVSAGKRRITHIALACLDAPEGRGMPCGACRQWIAELAPDATIFIDGIEEAFSIQQLLPRRFDLET